MNIQGGQETGCVDAPLRERRVAALHGVHVRKAVGHEVLSGEAHLVHPGRAQNAAVELRIAFKVGERELLLLGRHPRGEVDLVRAGGVAEAEGDVGPGRAFRLALVNEILASMGFSKQEYWSGVPLPSP